MAIRRSILISAVSEELDSALQEFIAIGLPLPPLDNGKPTGGLAGAVDELRRHRGQGSILRGHDFVLRGVETGPPSQRSTKG